MNGKHIRTVKATSVMKAKIKLFVLLAVWVTCTWRVKADDYKSDQEYEKLKTYIERTVFYPDGNSGQLQLLVMCIDRGDAAILDKLLDAAPDFANVNEGMSGCSPVFWAVFKGDTNILTMLVKHGADIKKKGTNWEISTLHIARDVQTVEFLLSHGIDIEVKDAASQTPLMWAAKRGNLEAVNALIEHGAKVNTQDKNGWTALEFAQAWDKTNTVALLTAKGAAPSRKTKDDFPYDIAVGSWLTYGTNHPFADTTLLFGSPNPLTNSHAIELKK